MIQQLGLAFVGALAMAVCGASASAQSQTYGDAMRAAEQRLEALNDQTLADSFAFAQCEHGIAERSEVIARVWCAIGSRRAVSRIDSWGGPRPGPELETVRRALWLNAVDGLRLQNNPWWGSPRSETIYIGDGVRGPAYTLIAVMNRGEPTLPEFRFEGLARVAGVVRERREPLDSLRRRTLETLLSKMPLDEHERANTLWAVAATGLTIDIAQAGGDRQVFALEVYARISGLAESTEGYGGEDAMLAPALYLSEGWSALWAQEFAAAERLLGRGTELCPARLWHGAAICNMLEFAYARAVAAARAHSSDPTEQGVSQEPHEAPRD
ncbi:MAG: hypothetical protein ACREH4_12205 [Vitreimonas sp.]